MSASLDALDGIPRQPLAHLPTPLEPLERLSAAAGGPRLLVKRDDCTGLGLGGKPELPQWSMHHRGSFLRFL